MKTFLSDLNIWSDIDKAHAQELIPCPDGTMAEESVGCVKTPEAIVKPYTSMPELFLRLASILMNISVFAATVMLMYGAIVYVLSASDERKIQKAKRIMFWSLIGLVLALIARFVVNYFLGIVT